MVLAAGWWGASALIDSRREVGALEAIGEDAPVEPEAPKLSPVIEEPVVRNEGEITKPRTEITSAEEKEADVPLDPGSVKTSEAEAGVSVTGWVVGGTGKPISGATVRLSTMDPLGVNVRRKNQTTTSTGADGAFRLGGLGAGTGSLRVRADGYLRAEVELGELFVGQVAAGVRVQLEEARILSGVVLGPDGSPAVRAMVELEPVDEKQRVGRWRTASKKTDEDGRFHFDELRDGLVNLRVTAQSEVEVEVPSELTGRILRRRKPGAELSFATLLEVPTGTEGLVIRLSREVSVRGRVRTVDGAAVPRFSVQLRLLDWHPDLEHETRWVDRTFQDDEGEFAIYGLVPSAWELVVALPEEGFVDSAPLSLTLPHGDELVIEVQPEARVHGVVQGPRGEAVVGARVRVENAADYRCASSAKTDDAGRFELGNLLPGPSVLEVDADGWLEHAPLELDLRLGDVNPLVDITLSYGGRLTGEVVTPLDDFSEYEVSVAMLRARFFETLELDEHGRFVIEGLPGGEGTASLRPGQEESRSASSLKRRPLDTATFTMPEGGTVHVVLGATPREAISILGRVTSGERGVEGVSVSAEKTAGDRQSRVAATTDTEGRYRLVVDGPGVRRLWVKVDGSACLGEEHDIPARREVHVDLRLPTASISGRVIDENGEPITGGKTRVERLGEHDSRAFPRFSSYRFAKTDEDGAFTVRYLVSGEYELHAAAPWEGEWAGHVRGEVKGLRLIDGQAFTAPDLVLFPGATILGWVRPAPTRQAGEGGLKIVIRRADGTHQASCGVGLNGWFQRPRIPPGTYEIFAARNTRNGTSLEVVVGGTETVEVELALP